jgi:fucose 4-O-acetylase-like acetyltransferase
MAKTTIIFAVLLIVLGVGAYLYTGHQYPTALIPAAFGLVMGLFGVLAMSPSESRRKLFMHINVTLGAIGFLMAAGRALNSYGTARSEGVDPNYFALGTQAIMAALLLNYVVLCVKSFIDVRRARQLD